MTAAVRRCRAVLPETMKTAAQYLRRFVGARTQADNACLVALLRASRSVLREIRHTRLPWTRPFCCNRNEFQHGLAILAGQIETLPGCQRSPRSTGVDRFGQAL